ncbi:Aste57867_10438 [Aphanomyces stellatus]|uniref:Aste57867_10438 protein n=1 Tax=Aphanomyces stellatus TaxID=120398 RepID=A0A485KRC0_9STRA|nr:hypothetical protein As57867_010398 [Aphanomyces stellatus]VFT87312.1 Aste57867_10438 [Aphanomyces stellatus]
MRLKWAKPCRPISGAPIVASATFDIWCLGVLVLKLFIKDGILVEFSGIGNKDILDVIADPEFSFHDSIHQATELSGRQRKYLLRCLDPDPTKRATSVETILELVKMKTTTVSIVVPSISPPPEHLDSALARLNHSNGWPSDDLRWKDETFHLVIQGEMAIPSQSINSGCSAEGLVLTRGLQPVALPILKAGYVFLQCLGLAKSAYGLSIGDPFLFNLNKLNLPGKCLQALEIIHGAVPDLASTETFQDILDKLMDPTLEDAVAQHQTQLLLEAFLKFRRSDEIESAMKTLQQVDVQAKDIHVDPHCIIS